MSARLAMLCGLLLLAPPLAGQRVHEIRLRHPGPDEFRFAPARLVVGASDVIEFKVEEGGPYVVGFEPSDFAPADRARLQQALPAVRYRSLQQRSGVKLRHPLRPAIQTVPRTLCRLPRSVMASLS